MQLSNPRRRSIFSGSMGCCLAAILFTGTASAGVVAHWSFDKTDSDGTYRDSVDNAHPATPADRAEVQVYSGSDAPFGKAVTFLGPAHPKSYLTIPPLTNIQTTSLTVAAWVNLGSQNSAFILADWPSMTQSAYAFGFHPWGPNKNTAQPNGNITSTEMTPARPPGGRGSATQRRSIIDQKLQDKFVPLNEWHHVAWVWDREYGTLTFYCDGVSWADAKRVPPNPNYSKTLDIAVNNLPVRIGSQELSVGQGSANLTGSIDELWIFDEALTPVLLQKLIKDNDIHGARATATASTNTAATTATGVGNPEPAPVVTPEPAPIDTSVTPSPTAVPDRSTRSAVGSISDRRASPARAVGIVTCLTIIVAACCYLAWALIERAKLRAAGQLR